MISKWCSLIRSALTEIPPSWISFDCNQDADDDDDTGTLIVQLLQKDKRKIRHQMHQAQDIGFFIYKQLEGYPFPLPKVGLVFACDHNFFTHLRTMYMEMRKEKLFL